MNQNGLLQCIKYSLPPNSLRYCGPDKTSTIADYQKEQIVDEELASIMRQFQTLYVYLKLIAHENNIKDPFDPRVVEAYWIGNELLHHISSKSLYRCFVEEHQLKKRLKSSDFNWLVGKLPQTILPHHSFHVLNVFVRTGHHTAEHTLDTMDKCRIGWGKVLKFSIINDQLSMNKKNVQMIKVLTKPLILRNGTLVLGKPVVKEIVLSFSDNRQLTTDCQNHYISFHWNQFCDFVTPTQVANLERYTQIAINLANKSM